MSILPKTSAKPPRIEITFIRDDYDPTPKEINAIKALRAQVAKHASDVGVHYTALKIDNYPPGYEGKDDFYPNFETTITNGKPVFAANIHTTLGAMSSGIGLEGVIKHEAAHIIENNFEALNNLRLLQSLFKALDGLADALSSAPEATRQRIRTEFRSVAQFKRSLERFEKSLHPVMSAMEQNSEMLDASPEKIARLMESRDSAYLEMKRALQAMPAGDLAIYRTRLEACAENTSAHAVANTSSSGADIISTLRRLSGSGTRGQSLEQFINAFKKGEEYYVDAFASRHSKDPDSVAKFLEWYTVFRGKTLSTDDWPEHPSDDKRIRRMQYLNAHGTPPPDEYLRPDITAEAKPQFLHTILSETGDITAEKSRER